MPFAMTWMDLEIIILSEVSQTSMTWYFLYMELKKWYKWTYLQDRNRVPDVENELMITKGKRGKG